MSNLKKGKYVQAKSTENLRKQKAAIINYYIKKRQAEKEKKAK